MFQQKIIKVGIHKHSFSPAMYGWRVFPTTKDAECRRKLGVKLINSININIITSFFSECLVKFLKNSINYVVSREVSGAVKVALLRALLRAFVNIYLP